MYEIYKSIPKSAKIFIAVAIAAIYIFVIVLVASSFIRNARQTNATMEQIDKFMDNYPGFSNKLPSNNSANNSSNSSTTPAGSDNTDEPSTEPSAPANSDEEFAQSQKTTPFVFRFMELGSADCTLVTDVTNSMLIDTGSPDTIDSVMRQLRFDGIDKLSVLIITNEHQDHIGGLAHILENITVETLIIPNVDTDNEFMKDCIALANEKGVAVLNAKAFFAWNVGEAQCQILSAEENVIIRITVGGKAFLMLSDATPEEEIALLDLGIDVSCDVLKASACGAEGTASNEFLKWTHPDYSILSCCEDELNLKVANRLFSYSFLYRTYRDGMITIVTNGDRMVIGSDR